LYITDQNACGARCDLQDFQPPERFDHARDVEKHPHAVFKFWIFCRTAGKIGKRNLHAPEDLSRGEKAALRVPRACQHRIGHLVLRRPEKNGFSEFLCNARFGKLCSKVAVR
jgi:hypothetical protein